MAASKSFILLLASLLIVDTVSSSVPAPPPAAAAAAADGNVIFEGAPPPSLPPPSLPPRSEIKFRIQLFLFCLVMVAIVSFLLWLFSPRLRSLYYEWGMGRKGDISMTPRPVNFGPPTSPSPSATDHPRPTPTTPSPSATDQPRPTPTAPPIPSPPRVLSCHVCGYPSCRLYVACPCCGQISTLSAI